MCANNPRFDSAGKGLNRADDVCQFFNGADDGIRTRDLYLGKVPLYQLSHVRNVNILHLVTVT
jgi:hypothetical protein